MSGDNWTFWFKLANLVLGSFTLLGLLVVLGAVGWDLLTRKSRHSAR